MQQIYRILQKTAPDPLNNPERTFIPFRAELLRWIAAFSRKLIFEGRDFRLPLSTSKQFYQGFWREVFHAGYAVRTWNFFWFVRENSCCNFLPRPLNLNFHLTFYITYFRQHLHNLISEGKTNLWAEYNDGCVQRGGIHSLLFCYLFVK